MGNPTVDPNETYLHPRYTRQNGLLPQEKIFDSHVLIVGVGAVGRQLALQFAALGVGTLTLVDHDMIEIHNLSNQGFKDLQLGKSKVMATRQDCFELNNKLKVLIYRAKYSKKYLIGKDFVCSCTDSMEIRKLMFEHTCELGIPMIDSRMAAETIRILAATDDPSREHYATTLFSDEEADPGQCTARSTIYGANLAAAFLTLSFAKHIREIPLDKDMFMNALTFEALDLSRKEECHVDPNGLDHVASDNSDTSANVQLEEQGE